LKFPGRKLVTASELGVSHITVEAVSLFVTGLPPGTDNPSSLAAGLAQQQSRRQVMTDPAGGLG
jgi:hypothetical protein